MPPAKQAKNVGLADVLQSSPTAGVTKRKTPAAIKKENRDQLREVKHAIESELHNGDHDLLFKTAFISDSTIALGW